MKARALWRTLTIDGYFAEQLARNPMPTLLRRSRKGERREQHAQSGAQSDETGDGSGDMLTDRYGLAVSTTVALIYFAIAWPLTQLVYVVERTLRRQE